MSNASETHQKTHHRGHSLKTWHNVTETFNNAICTAVKTTPSQPACKWTIKSHDAAAFQQTEISKNTEPTSSADWLWQQNKPQSRSHNESAEWGFTDTAHAVIAFLAKLKWVFTWSQTQMRWDENLLSLPLSLGTDWEWKPQTTKTPSLQDAHAHAHIPSRTGRPWREQECRLVNTSHQPDQESKLLLWQQTGGPLTGALWNLVAGNILRLFQDLVTHYHIISINYR